MSNSMFVRVQTGNTTLLLKEAAHLLDYPKEFLLHSDLKRMLETLGFKSHFDSVLDNELL